MVLLFLLLVGAVVWAFAMATDMAPVAVPLAVIIAIAATWASYYFSDRIVLGISRARPVDKNELPYLVNITEAVAIGAGVPVPELYIIEDTAPNAFATGRNPRNSVVCVTRGLVQKLNREELEGVIAHEVAHIRNYDILLATVAVTMVGIVALLSDWMLRFSWRSGRRRSRSHGSGGDAAGAVLLLIGLIVAILAPLVAQLLRFSLSRRREFQADATAVQITRYPPGLANALRKIAADPEPLEVANKATAHLYIYNPLKDMEGPVDRLFNTHPPIAERVKVLESMS
ncbi:MAG: zinc metalloprotease HtpX [Bacillota bacterium]|nr:MAG: zinc metalloprotease HtpX [Bacillota bacterium]